MNYDTNAEDIQQDMLDNMPSKYAKSVGFWLWDILKSIALEFKNVFDAINDVGSKLLPENLESDELDVYVNGWSDITRKNATYATGVVTVTGTGTIYKGAKFENKRGVVYYATAVTEVADNADIEIVCADIGSIGNTESETIIKIPKTIKGIKSVTNKKAITNGADEETDERLLARFYESQRSKAGAGNKDNYVAWAKSVEGVGSAKCISCWAGENTVKVVIVANDGSNADDELVDAVQKLIDPNKNGDGIGLAPIGAVCTVVKANEKLINISCDIDYIGEIGTVIASITESINSYIKSIALTGKSLNYGKVGDLIYHTDGVTGYENLRLNDTTENVTCNENEIFVISKLNIT